MTTVKLYNLARVNTATLGTGTLTLGSAITGYLSFADAGVQDGDEVSYGIKDGSNTEVGRGTYGASGTTLTRGALKSTNSDSEINITSGVAEVYITPLGEDFGERVGGPASSTDGNIALFDGTDGKKIKDGGKGVPSGAIVGTTDTQALENKTLNDTTDSANVFPLIVEGDRATPTNNDIVGAKFNLSNNAGAQKEFGRISVRATNVASGSETGQIIFAVPNAGSGASSEMQLNPSNLSPWTNDGLALGNTLQQWSDGFWASGAVLNWNNGDYTLTHSAGVLTANKDLRVTTPGTNSASVLTRAIGVAKTASSSATDADTLTDEGRYYVASTVENIPPVAVNWLIEVEAATSTYCVQTAYSITGTEMSVYRRWRKASTWGSWQKVGADDGVIIAPQGRLTLTTVVPVTTSDVTGATTIYYTPMIGQSVPLYDGSKTTMASIGAELSLALDATSGHTGYHQSGKNFDLFVVDDSGTMRLVSGPACPSNTSRGTGSGTTELEMKNGFWTNKNSMTGRHGSSSGNTITVAANCGIYVGSFRATADGQATDAKAKRLLYNAYNQAMRSLLRQDSTVTWTYGSLTLRQANANTDNKVEVLIGLGGALVDLVYASQALDTASNSASRVGIGIDSITVDSSTANSSGRSSDGGVVPIAAYYRDYISLGYHYAAMLEVSSTVGTVTFTGKPSGLSGTVFA